MNLPAGVLLMKYSALPIIGYEDGPPTFRNRKSARIEL